MDFSHLDSAIYGDNDDDDDEELLAELLSLEKEEKRKNAVKQPSKPPSTGTFTVKKPMVVSPNMDDNLDDDLDDEDFENDEDLQNELSKLIETEGVSLPTGPSPAPPIASSTASTSSLQQMEVLPTNNVGTNKPAEIPVHKSAATSQQVSSSTAACAEEAPSEKFRKILIKRRDAFMANAIAAKKAEDKENAVEFLNMVKTFNEALKATLEVELSEADFNLAPKTPPPYRKKTQPTTLLEELEARMAKYQELVQKFKESGEDQRARMNTRMIGTYKDAIAAYKKGQPIDVTTLPVPPGFQPLTPTSYPSMPAKPSGGVDVAAEQRQVPGPSSKAAAAPVASEQQNQLKFLLTRQLQYKQAAVDAKKRGDLETAKLMLINSKKMEPMIEASKSGLPVNISQVPVAPQANVPGATTNNASTLEKELIKQIQTCDQLRQQFTRLNDTKSVLFIENLLNETKKDLLYFRQCFKAGQMPKYAIVEQHLPALEKHSEIPEDVLQLKILSINKLKMAEGWKPKDCSIYVTYDFPFPHEKHQTGRTQTVSGTDNPEFSDVFQLSINRKALRFNSIIKKRPIKLEIYQKGNLFRSDKIWGSADVPLIELEKYASITKTVEIVEGRRKIGGTISVEVCVSKPIGDGQGTQTVVKKWLKIQR
uniref:C2 domain-containing protein n=1 Tax=Acrobeloides nanus TaxID=290746 RepID=A0A914DIC7_9BILA